MVLRTKFSQKTHYETMGVKEDASHEEIRKTYRMSILNCHPDKHLQRTSETSNHKYESGSEFLEIQRAWEILSDPRSRALYDNELQILRQNSAAADDLRLQDMTVEDAGDCFEFSYHCRHQEDLYQHQLFFHVDLALLKSGYTLMQSLHCRFFPDKAESLALEIVTELVQELKIQPCPVVFASFSGGPKACMYKLLHVIEGKCDTQVNLHDLRLVKYRLCGNIFDSTPVDFTSDLGTRFVLHPSVLKMSRPPRMVTWIANGISSSLDALFLSRFESQRAEYWQTLYSTVSMGAPYLILCSEDDDLAPFQVIFNFATRLKDLGADVKMVKWNSSSHVGHFRNYPVEYTAAVTELLGKAVAIYSQRIRQLEGEKMGFEGTDTEISDPFHNLRKAASRSNQSFERITLDLNNHFVAPGSVEYHEDRGVGSVQDERKEHYIPLSSPPKIGVHGILGQFLFDVCVPKNVENWDIGSSHTLRREPFMSGRRHSAFNPMKCLRRSRL